MFRDLLSVEKEEKEKKVKSLSTTRTTMKKVVIAAKTTSHLSHIQDLVLLLFVGLAVTLLVGGLPLWLFFLSAGEGFFAVLFATFLGGAGFFLAASFFAGEDDLEWPCFFLLLRMFIAHPGSCSQGLRKILDVQ